MESTVMHKNLLKYFHNIPKRKTTEVLILQILFVV